MELQVRGFLKDLISHHNGPNSRWSQGGGVTSRNNQIPLLSLQNRIADLRRFARSNSRAKEEDNGLTTPPNYTLNVGNGADAFNLEGATDGVIFPPSRRKDGKVKQEDTPTSLAGCGKWLPAFAYASADRPAAFSALPLGRRVPAYRGLEGEKGTFLNILPVLFDQEICRAN